MTVATPTTQLPPPSADACLGDGTLPPDGPKVGGRRVWLVLIVVGAVVALLAVLTLAWRSASTELEDVKAANDDLTAQIADLEVLNGQLETEGAAVAGELRELQTEHSELQDNFAAIDRLYAAALDEQFALEDERDAAVDAAAACQDFLAATGVVLADYQDMSRFFTALLSGESDSIDMDYVRRLSDGNTAENVGALADPLSACKQSTP